MGLIGSTWIRPGFDRVDLHRLTLAVNVVRSAAAAPVPATVKVIMVSEKAASGPSAGAAPVTLKVPARSACQVLLAKSQNATYEYSS